MFFARCLSYAQSSSWSRSPMVRASRKLGHFGEVSSKTPVDGFFGFLGLAVPTPRLTRPVRAVPPCRRPCVRPACRTGPRTDQPSDAPARAPPPAHSPSRSSTCLNLDLDRSMQTPLRSVCLLAALLYAPIRQRRQRGLPFCVFADRACAPCGALQVYLDGENNW